MGLKTGEFVGHTRLAGAMVGEEVEVGHRVGSEVGLYVGSAVGADVG